MTNQRCGLAGLACSSLAPARQQVRPSQVVEDLHGHPPDRDSGRQVPDSPPGVAKLASMMTSTPRAIGFFRFARQVQPLPATADRLALLAELGVHQASACHAIGQRGGIAGRGTRPQSLLGLTVPASQAVAPAAAAGMRQR